MFQFAHVLQPVLVVEQRNKKLDKPSNDINTTWNKKYNTAKKQIQSLVTLTWMR